MLVLEHISKSWGDVAALRDVSVAIPSAGYAVIVGPSGSGKSTILRAIAGHVALDSGRVLLAGTDLTTLPAHKRPVASVFQNYALFPHMSVGRNIAFGLEQQGLALDAIRSRVGDMLDLVGLQGLEDRSPAALSGGQQQRVALARALAVQPQAVMLDEPLGALDPDLRTTMRTELRRIQRESGVLFLHVSHDREEAWTLADHLLVLEAEQLIGSGPLDHLMASPQRQQIARVLGFDNVTSHPDNPGALLAFAPERVQIGVGAWRGRVLSVRQAGSWLERDILLDTGATIRQREILGTGSGQGAPGDEISLHVPDDAMRVVI